MKIKEVIAVETASFLFAASACAVAVVILALIK